MRHVSLPAALARLSLVLASAAACSPAATSSEPEGAGGGGASSPDADTPRADVVTSPEAGTPAPPATCSGTGPLLTMPVRVHLLASPVDALSTRLGAPDVAPIFDEVNEIWSQACIRFVIGDIVSETVPGSAGAIFERAVSTGDKEEVASALAMVVPKQATLERGVDVFVVKSFGIGALGRYFENLDSVVWADTRPDGKRVHRRNNP